MKYIQTYSAPITYSQTLWQTVEIELCNNLNYYSVTYPEAFCYRYTGMGAKIIGAQIIVK